MKAAGMNITFRHFPLTYFLDAMNELGIGHIELWAGEPHLYVYRNALGTIRSIRQQVAARNLKIVCYTPEQCVYPFNLAASDSDWRQKSIEYFKDNLYAAAELEAGTMLLTSGIGDFSVSLEESWKYAADSLFRLCEAAERKGITLALEPLTRFESNLITDAGGVKRMLEEVGSPALKGMIDTVAMQLAGEHPEDYWALPGGVSHVHLIDGDGQSDAHLALDDGVLNWRQYLAGLQQCGYEGACTLEIMGYAYYRNPKDTMKQSIGKLQELGVLSSG
ncbi:putative endonuclease [Paenibacillus mucilaginosus 3016]|uniref:Putative endonuclease n=1 Tax=Paenibacillus mucilaginosus 3016 TaxID=1116391 RepID=H6NMB1_9BACL|nr:TIM barrel protein [Paenibacillus mucilaginosus]AFC33273.1 putative endonuclease [Paenibacillus mucilaginosus 3016]WFA21696.1 endonuclease [Paenibacillus mucilaginosus]